MYGLYDLSAQSSPFVSDITVDMIADKEIIKVLPAQAMTNHSTKADTAAEKEVNIVQNASA